MHTFGSTVLHIPLLQLKAICQFPSEEFYGGKLKTDQSVREGYWTFLQKNPLLKSHFWEAGLDSPIMFCDVEGKEPKEKKTDRNVALQSKSNKLEANCMVSAELCEY